MLFFHWITQLCYIPLLVYTRHIIGTTQTSEMECLPFLVSLQVVWSERQLLLGDQTGSEERRRKNNSLVLCHTHKDELHVDVQNYDTKVILYRMNGCIVIL